MPTVKSKSGKVKHFPYTAKGKKAAKSYSKKTGMPMTVAQMKKMGKKGMK